jgi:hypothetical protein
MDTKESVKDFLGKKIETLNKEKEFLLKIRLEESKMFDKHILYISFATLGFTLNFMAKAAKISLEAKGLFLLSCLLLITVIYLALITLMQNNDILKLKEELIALEIEINSKMLVLMLNMLNIAKGAMQKEKLNQEIKELEQKKKVLKRKLENSSEELKIRERNREMLALLILSIILIAIAFFIA